MKWKVRLNATFISETSQPPPDPVSHFIESVNNLFGHVFEDVGGGDIFGFTIYNEVNQSDTPIGCSFRRKDQLSSDVIRSAFDKVKPSNSRFNARTH